MSSTESPVLMLYLNTELLSTTNLVRVQSPVLRNRTVTRWASNTSSRIQYIGSRDELLGPRMPALPAPLLSALQHNRAGLVHARTRYMCARSLDADMRAVCSLQTCQQALYTRGRACSGEHGCWRGFRRAQHEWRSIHLWRRMMLYTPMEARGGT